MLFSISLLAFVACEKEFDKDGENLTVEPSVSVEVIPDQLDDSDHDWDEDGFTEDDGDCNDDDADIHPEQEEVYYNDIDENCDERSDFDADLDGYDSFSWGGDDCDDDNEEAYPGAPEDHFDGIDTDCDGQPDPRFPTEEIDPTTLVANGQNAMALDNTGRLHVVYEDDGQIWYSNSSEFGAWRTPTRIKNNNGTILASDGLDGVMDSLNRFHITYTSQDIATGSISAQYTYMPTTGNWIGPFEVDGESTTQSTQVGYFIEIDMGSDRLPVFGYYNQNIRRPIVTKISDIPSSFNELNFIYRHEADYLIYTSSEQGTGEHISLAVDDNNRSHVVFLDNTAPYGTGASPQSQYSSYNDVTDVCESSKMAEPGGFWHSAAIRPDGNLCVAYQDMNTLSLKYACQTGSGCNGWTVLDVDPAEGTGAYASLAFNSQSQPYIAYYDSSIGALKIATQLGPNWELDTIDDQGTTDVGRFTNIAIDAEDRVHITYYNVTSRNIWHALGQ